MCVLARKLAHINFDNAVSNYSTRHINSMNQWISCNRNPFKICIKVFNALRARCFMGAKSHFECIASSALVFRKWLRGARGLWTKITVWWLMLSREHLECTDWTFLRWIRLQNVSFRCTRQWLMTNNFLVVDFVEEKKAIFHYMWAINIFYFPEVIIILLTLTRTHQPTHTLSIFIIRRAEAQMSPCLLSVLPGTLRIRCMCTVALNREYMANVG